MSATSFAIATDNSTDAYPHLVTVAYPLRRLYHDHRIRKLEGLIQHNLHLKLGLRALAAVIALSPSRFSHLFKTQTGMSPAQYLKSVRIQRAKDLLESTHLSIKEVAGRVGLDSSRLGKSFKAVYGVTPLQYRVRTCNQTCALGGSAQITRG